MHIVEIYSHQNGREYLEIHKPTLWSEIITAINTFDVPHPVGGDGAIVHKLAELEAQFATQLILLGWRSAPPVLQEAQILQPVGYAGSVAEMYPLSAMPDTAVADRGDKLFKERIGVALHFQQWPSATYEVFAHHMTAYQFDVIDVGIEILPMKSMSAEMSSGICYYEGELYNVLRHGRGTPAVPLVLIGVAPA